jgi:hypothetical protein
MTTTRQRANWRWLAAASLCVLAACDKSNDGGKKDEIAKAFSGPPIVSEEKASKGMAELKAKAEAEALAARNAELEKLTGSPPEVADLEAACTDAGAAFDEFKQKRVLDEELERWNATKEPDIRKVVETCKSSESPKVASCQATALRTASVANFGPDSAAELTQYCTEKWGEGEGEGKAAAG